MAQDAGPYSGAVTFRFYEELNDLLPRQCQKLPFSFELRGRRTVKDAIESLNVPHTEVDLVLVNGRSVGFDALLRTGDRIAVYPLFESLDIGAVQRLRPAPLRRPAFVCDVHLGSLARKLRLLGFDTAFRNNYEDGEIVAVQAAERRAILTCDRQLLMRVSVRWGYLVRSRQTATQVGEVLQRFDLYRTIRAFSRCSRCNAPLEPAIQAEIRRLAPASVRARHQTFQQCGGCGQLYWKGTHYERIVAWVAALRQQGPHPHPPAAEDGPRP